MGNISHPLSILRREFLARTVETLAPKSAVIVPQETPQLQGIDQMCKDRVGCLLISDVAQEIVGIVTERDVLNKWNVRKQDDGATIRALMTPNPQALKKHASVARVVYMMAIGGFRHVPIFYPAPELPKIISSKGFVDTIHRRLTSKILDPDSKINLDDNVLDQFFGATVDVLKPDPALVVHVADKVEKALALMRKNSKGAVVVFDQKKSIAGIFTEQDYLTRISLGRQDPAIVTMREVMTIRPRTLPTTASVAIAFSLLSEGGYRHIPLVDAKEALKGIISVRSFLSYLSASIISALESYEK